MSRVSKFLENELDKVNEYLSMAKARLVVTSELCEDRCKKITDQLSEKDEKVIDYLDDEISRLEIKIHDAGEIIEKFKDFYFNLEGKEEFIHKK